MEMESYSKYVAFCDWLLSLSIMFSRFIHVVACISTSFLFITEYYSIIWTYHISFIDSSYDRHLGYFVSWNCRYTCKYLKLSVNS